MKRQCCQIWIMLLCMVTMRWTTVAADLAFQEPPRPPVPPPRPLNVSSASIFNSNCTDLCLRNAANFNITSSRKSMEQLKFRNHNVTSTMTIPNRTLTITTQRRPSMGTIAEDDPWGSAHTMNNPIPQTRQFNPLATLFGNPDLNGVPIVREGRVFSTESAERILLTKSAATASSTTTTRATLHTTMTKLSANTTISHRLTTTSPAEKSAQPKSLRITTAVTRINTTAKLTTKNRGHRFRDSDVAVFNGTSEDSYLLTLNGSCHEIENSDAGTQGFVTAFETALAEFFDTLTPEKIRIWQIACGSVIVNFSFFNWESGAYYHDLKHQILEGNLTVPFDGKLYQAVGFDRVHEIDHILAHLEVAPAAGHVYQGMIYIIVGVVVGVLALVVAILLIVRLQRRKGRASGFAVSGDSTPIKYDNVHDYTLTRIPRTTKLFLDDVERNPWAYTNPDFHGSLSSIAAPGKKMEYLNFVNTGVIPMRDRSPGSSTTKNPLLSVTTVTDSSSDGKSSGNAQGRKNAKDDRGDVKQSFMGLGQVEVRGNGTPVPVSVKITQDDVWNSSHI